MARPSGERGFALLIVLWSVVLLTLIVTGITAAGRTDIQLAANLRGAAQAEQAADGAVFEAAFHLLDPARTWPADGRPIEIAVPGARVVLRIQDQAGKVNPNVVSRDLLRSLLESSGAGLDPADALAGQIVAWRSPRPRPGAGPALNAALGTDGGQQVPGPMVLAREYRAAGLDYDPPGAPFQTIDELGLVLGMTPDLLTRLTPRLSLLNESTPDPVLADAVVLQALRTAGMMPPGAALRPPSPPRAVLIEAEAVTPSGARFIRRAGIRLGRAEQERPVTVVGWE